MRAHLTRGIARLYRATAAAAAALPTPVPSLTIVWRTIDSPEAWTPAVYSPGAVSTHQLTLVAALEGGHYRRSPWFILADVLYALMYPASAGAADTHDIRERVAAMERRLANPYDPYAVALGDHGAWAWLELDRDLDLDLADGTRAGTGYNASGRLLAQLAPLLALVQRLPPQSPRVMDPRRVVELDPMPAWLRVGDEERVTRTYYADMAPAAVKAETEDVTVVFADDPLDDDDDDDDALLDALEYSMRRVVLASDTFPRDTLLAGARQEMGLVDEGAEWLYG